MVGSYIQNDTYYNFRSLEGGYTLTLSGTEYLDSEQRSKKHVQNEHTTS